MTGPGQRGSYRARKRANSPAGLAHPPQAPKRERWPQVSLYRFGRYLQPLSLLRGSSSVGAG